MLSRSLFVACRRGGRFIPRPRVPPLACGVFARGLLTRPSPGISALSRRIALNQPWVRCMSILKSPYPSLDIPKMPLAQFIMKDFDKWPQNTALVDSVTEKTYTFKEVKKYARSVGSSLLKAGIKAGDVVCIHSQNCPEYVFAFLGVAGIGAVATLANPGYTSREILYQLQDSGAKHFITAANLLEPARQAAKNHARLKNMFVIGGDHIPGCRPFTDLLEDDGSAFPDDLAFDPEDTIVLPYSSGTTGLPKGVMLSHYNIVSNMTGLTSDEKLLRMFPKDCLLGFLPFYHAYGLVVIIGVGLLSGAKIVTIPKFEAEPFLRFIEQHKATKLLIVPPVGVLLAKHPLVDKIDFSSVNDILCGAAPMGSETEEAIRKRTGLRTRQGYGMTELSPAGMILHQSTDSSKQGSVGTLVPMTEAKIRDIETGVLLGPGQDGEICIRGPLVMKGYLNNPEATQNCMEKDGWLRTGDIGHYDEEGYFYIVDRLKELIKYKSSQVAPAELEELILSMPGVLDTAVVGKPCEDAGELPLAFVVRKPNADEITEEDIIKFIEERVAPTKRLRGGVVFVDEISKSPSGKILRRVLRDGLKKVD